MDSTVRYRGVELSLRGPSKTIRIFSSAENCRRVLRLISFTCLSANPFGPVFVLISYPFKDYDEPKILAKQNCRSVSKAVTDTEIIGSRIELNRLKALKKQVYRGCYLLKLFIKFSNSDLKNARRYRCQKLRHYNDRLIFEVKKRLSLFAGFGALDVGSKEASSDKFVGLRV